MYQPYGTLNTQKQRVGIAVIAFDFLVLWYYFFSGTTALRPMAGFFWIGIAFVGMLLFQIKSVQLTPYIALGIAGIIGICLSIPTSYIVSTSVKYALSIALYFLVAFQVTRLKENMSVLLVLMMSFSLLLVSVTYIQAFAPDVFNAFFLPLLPVRFHERILVFMHNESYPGFYNQTSANAVAMSLGCCLSMYYLSRSSERRFIYRILSTVAIMLFLYGLILTNRRGSTVTIAFLIALFLLGRIKNPYVKVFVVFGLGAFVLSGIWKEIPFLENLINKTEMYASEGDVTNGRLTTWGETIQLFLNKPIAGYGADMYGYVATAGYAHNSYLQSLSELGLVGALLFYTPFIYGLRRTISIYKRRQYFAAQEKSIVEFCLCWQLYCFINAMFESFFATEVAVFMLYVVQMMCIRIEESH